MVLYVRHQMLTEAVLVEWERPKQSPKPAKYHAGRAPESSPNPHGFQEVSEKQSYVK